MNVDRRGNSSAPAPVGPLSTQPGGGSLPYVNQSSQIACALLKLVARLRLHELWIMHQMMPRYWDSGWSWQSASIG
jgi:hypothetical protein